MRRQFVPSVAGKYKVQLEVEDDDGQVSDGRNPLCQPAQVTITAGPAERIYVEVTWNNPEDPDPLDETGSDLDLHLIKQSVGRIGQAPYDCHFANPTPDWSPETPRLLSDDTSGAGVETIVLDNPADCAWYAVGTHYGRAQFGTAYATLRVYIDGAQVYEDLNRPHQQSGDYWDLVRIHWPSGEVVPVEIAFPVYPMGSAPTFTPGQEAADLCGDE